MNEAMNVSQQVLTPEEKAAKAEKANRRRTEAIGEADRVLRVLWHAIYAHQQSNIAAEQRIDGDENYLLGEIKKARGAIAEWRPATD